MPIVRNRQLMASRESGRNTTLGNIDSALVRRLFGRGDMISFASEDLADSISEIAESAHDTADSASRASAATGQVAAEANAVASAAEEMSAAMQEVASSAASATDVAREAGGVVGEVVSSVHRLSTSTERIDGVVRTVSGISDQTRLLALNATIEAARAGTAGRGFAVVAEEVKNLANQTTTATSEIAGQLADLVTDSERVRVAVERIDEVLQRVLGLQQTIAAAVEEQSAVIAEITRSASAVATAAGSLEESVHASANAAQVAQHAIDRAQLWLDRLRTTSGAQRRDRDQVGDALSAHPLRAALEAHAAWKGRIHTAVTSGRVPPELDLAATARDDVCEFGKWLRSGEAARADQARTTTVTRLHAEFHSAAAAVLSRVADGRLDEARAQCRAADGYGHAAPLLMDALMDWLAAVGEA